jgi:hypothetical protein
MRLEFQKPNGCGPACVARLAGVTLAQAERAVGKTRKTHTRDLRAGLRRLGFRPGEKLQRLGPTETPPDGVIVKVRWHGGKDTHWVVHERNGRVACPLHGWVQLNAYLRRRATVLSYLPMRVRR